MGTARGTKNPGKLYGKLNKRLRPERAAGGKRGVSRARERERVGVGPHAHQKMQT